MRTELIVNGEFRAAGGENGSLDQNGKMELSFHVPDADAATLELDAVFRNAVHAAPRGAGYTVEIFDDSGAVVFRDTVLPTSPHLERMRFSVDFPIPGHYTLRFTKTIGTHSDGALVDDDAFRNCLAAGSMIETLAGPRPIETLREGDPVMTALGPCPVRWIGQRRFGPEDLDRNRKLRPVRITAGALGAGLPKHDLLLSRQHRMLAYSPMVEEMFGTQVILVSAIRLAGLRGIYIDSELREVTYIPVLLDRHAVIFANGAPTESLYPGPTILQALKDTHPRAVKADDGGLSETETPAPHAAPVPPGRDQRKFVARLSESGQSVLAPAVATSEPERKAGSHPVPGE